MSTSQLRAESSKSLYELLPNNKVIEFNGTYWHKNLKHVDEIRKYILEKNHGMSVMFVDECEYYKNPDIILAKCVNFLEET